MKITEIKQQVKRQDRYSIFMDGKYSFALSDTELLNLGLKKGDEYTQEGFEELNQKAVADKAYSRSLDLIARRARSEWEISDYLKRKETEPDVINQVITRLKDRKYLNDLEFSLSWINTRRQLKNSSNRKLKAELFQKHVKESIIDQAFDSLPDLDKDNLKLLIEKKRRQTRYQDDQKLMAYLSRQGFGYSDIKEALEL